MPRPFVLHRAYDIFIILYHSYSSALSFSFPRKTDDDGFDCFSVSSFISCVRENINLKLFFLLSLQIRFSQSSICNNFRFFFLPFFVVFQMSLLLVSSNPVDLVHGFGYIECIMLFQFRIFFSSFFENCVCDFRFSFSPFFAIVERSRFAATIILYNIFMDFLIRNNE